MEPRAARDLNCKQWEVRPSHVSDEVRHQMYGRWADESLRRHSDSDHRQARPLRTMVRIDKNYNLSVFSLQGW